MAIGRMTLGDPHGATRGSGSTAAVLPLLAASLRGCRGQLGGEISCK